MKNLFLLTIVFSVLIISCNNSNQNVDVKDTTKLVTTELVQEDLKTETDALAEPKSNIIEKYEYLHDIFSEQDSLYSVFISYLDALNGEVTSEKQIKNIFLLRNKLKNYASQKVEKYYYSKGENNYKLWQKVEKEIKSIGYLPVYAEGMYVDLSDAQILTEQMNKYASEAFKLNIKFDNEYAKSMGGEYPYVALEEYFNAFEPAYELYSKYKNTEYYKNIKERFADIIIQFADIHKLDNEQGMCFEGGLHYNAYPWTTTCNLAELFVKRFPKTSFTKAFQKLKNNMSSFNYKEEVYLVVTDVIMNNNIFEKAKEKQFKYLEDGIDVAHSVYFKNNENKNVIYLVYRFYSDKNEADEALGIIKQDLKDSKIVTLKINENGKIIEL